jgi:hypothetical protein
MVTLGVCCVWLGIAAPQCEGQPAEAERMLSPAKQAILEKMQRKRELRQQRQDDHQLQGESSHPLSTYADTAVARNPFQHKEEEHKRTVDAAAGVCTLPRCRVEAAPSPSLPHPPMVCLLLTETWSLLAFIQARTPTVMCVVVARCTLQHR